MQMPKVKEGSNLHFLLKSVGLTPKHFTVGAHSCAMDSRLKAAPTITLSERDMLRCALFAPLSAPLNAFDSFIGVFFAIVHSFRIKIFSHGLFNWGGDFFSEF